MGIYQLRYMDGVPEYAAVNECVKLARKFSHGHDKFINGALRGYGRKKDAIKDPKDLSVKYSYAPWIVELWTKAYGREKTEELLIAGNETADVCVRVNTTKISKTDLKDMLLERGYEVIDTDLETALFVRGSELIESEEYEKGYFSIQDLASQLAVERLAPKQGELVMDLCAAPGGKAMAAAEMMKNEGRIVASDIFENKVSAMEKMAERLGLSCVETRQRDAMDFDIAFEEAADAVIADVPCSCLGTIRRKPEIKYKEYDDELKMLPEKQFVILKTASRYVKKGGRLLYSTCTINPCENGEIVEKFLKGNSEFEKVSEEQLFTSQNGTDGFYICVMSRNKA